MSLGAGAPRAGSGWGCDRGESAPTADAPPVEGGGGEGGRDVSLGAGAPRAVAGGDATGANRRQRPTLRPSRVAGAKEAAT